MVSENIISGYKNGTFTTKIKNFKKTIDKNNKKRYINSGIKSALVLTSISHLNLHHSTSINIPQIQRKQVNYYDVVYSVLHFDYL